MKKCPYCGKEYPDDATVCLIDREPLPDNAPQLPPLAEQEVKASSDKDTPYLTFPDYQWSAKDAWKCIGIILVFEFVSFFVMRVFFLHFPQFLGRGFGFFSRSILHYGIWLLVAAYFARTETLTSFWKGFGLDHKPSDYVWFGLVCILTLRFTSHFMLIHGWGKGVSMDDISSFATTPGVERYIFPGSTNFALTSF